MEGENNVVIDIFYYLLWLYNYFFILEKNKVLGIKGVQGFMHVLNGNKKNLKHKLNQKKLKKSNREKNLLKF